MNIIAIDTTEEACSVALLQNDEIIEEFAIAPKQHNQLVFSMLETVMATAQMSINQCDAIAFSRGPGSFTGIRIACSMAQGLALASDLPLIAISSLEALAFQGVRLHQATDILAGLDARMEEIYWAAYHWSNNQMTLQGSEQLTMSSIACEQVAGPVCAIGSAWLNHAAPANAIVIADAKIHAQDIAIAAKRDFVLGKLLTPEQAQPLYLRNQITGEPNG